MNSQRPYFPNDILQVVDMSYAGISDQTACDWNVKLTHEDCPDESMSGINIFAKVDWNSVKFDVTKETSKNGHGDIFTDMVRVDPTYSFTTWADEYGYWYIYQYIFKANSLRIDKNGGGYFIGQDFEIQSEEIEKGIHKLTVSFKAVRDNLNYHGAFGFNGCCEPLYSEQPYEDCDTNSGGIDNNVPPCDDIEFSISEQSNSLVANVSGTPSTFSVAWYWRASNTSPWQLIISNASSVSLGQYGQYRAILTAAGCGQYIDSYLYQNPCAGFDVRIRRSTGNGVVAEVPTNFTGTTYVWEFNDGTGWVTLPDTGSAIVALETGDYRVTAINGDCEDQDVFYILISEIDACDFDVSIDVNDTTASANTDADNPTYQWTFENEVGQVTIGTGSTANLVETGIYWLTVTSGDCIKRAYTFYKAPVDCTPICITNWDEMPINQNPPQVTIINNVDACCDEEDPCPSLTLTITCVNRSLAIQGVPLTGTISWVGPGGFTGNGTPVTFPASTPSGIFTATVVDGACTYTATYNYTKPNAGTPTGNPIII